MKHFFEIALTALIAVFAAILGYLFSRDNLVVGACFTGIVSGLCIACSYTLGGMTLYEEEGAFCGKRLLWMAVAAVVAGVLGGLVMLG